MAMNHKVCVIVSAYNAESTIERCMESLLNQDYPDLELIVVDDASSDRTLEKASKYEVKVISKPQNRGAGHSRNLGVENANSDILVFVDSDVVVSATAVSQITRRLLEKQDILAVSGVYSQNTRNLNFISDYKNLRLAYNSNLQSCYRKYLGSYFFAMRKSTFLEAGGFSADLSGANVEDVEFSYRVTKGKSAIFLDKNARIDHLKRYTFFSMLKTNFNRIIGMNRVMKKFRNKYKASVEIPLPHIINLFLPGLILLSILIEMKFKIRYLTLLLISVFLINNLYFACFLVKARGILFSLKSLFILFIEYIAVEFSVFISFLTIAHGRHENK